MKFATHIILFGQDKWIMKNIENSYPHVDKIYVAYSKLPWGYNPIARNSYVNSFDINILKRSKFKDKIVIIEGDWLTEENQRNVCVDYANNDNIDYLMIHDADEFYHHNDFDVMINSIKKNPDYGLYRVGWYNFWKSFNYLTITNNGDIIAGYPEVFINLKKGVRFVRKRRVLQTTETTIKDVICYHGSYVLTDNEVKEKLNTWGHHADFNVNKWYNDTWLNWTDNKCNLHPITPNSWYKAVKFNGKLPEVLNKIN